MNMNAEESNEKKTESLRTRFDRILTDIEAQGVLGVANFKQVYNEFMPIQQERLRIIAGNRFQDLMALGSFVSIGIAYKERAIDDINVTQANEVDMKRWSNYALEYARINGILDHIVQVLAVELDGIAIPATLSGLLTEVRNVTAYFGLTVSHRTIAEIAGLGWRGKNGLIINEKFSCALRFASFMTEVPLLSGQSIESKCGHCTACEDVCSFIKHRTLLKDYRENCRRYMIYLQKQGLIDDVCGKCIKACYQNSIYNKQFRLEYG